MIPVNHLIGISQMCSNTGELGAILTDHPDKKHSYVTKDDNVQFPGAMKCITEPIFSPTR